VIRMLFFYHRFSFNFNVFLIFTGDVFFYLVSIFFFRVEIFVVWVLLFLFVWFKPLFLSQTGLIIDELTPSARLQTI
jgi:hypothetical protein